MFESTRIIVKLQAQLGYASSSRGQKTVACPNFTCKIVFMISKKNMLVAPLFYVAAVTTGLTQSGNENESASLFSSILSGSANYIANGVENSAIAGGNANELGSSSSYSLLSGYQNQIFSNSFGSFVGSGSSNSIGANSPYSSVVGGDRNSVSSTLSSIVGGQKNSIGVGAKSSVISGGYSNSVGVNSWHSFVGGGLVNNIVGPYEASVISGGERNTVSSSISTIGGGLRNSVSGLGTVVAGGGYNSASSPYSVVSGGFSNNVTGDWSTAGGSTISGGRYNTNFAPHGFLGGGSKNLLVSNAFSSTVVGGTSNAARGPHVALGGGSNNWASGAFSTVPGGTRARALHAGSFVWSGWPNGETVSFNTNSFLVRSPGGARFLTTTATQTPFVGVNLPPSGTAWVSLSAKESKTNFSEVNHRETLRKLGQLPLSAWSYKHDPASRRYIGPTSQEFNEQFGLGADPLGISTIDADGVALSAIKGLIQELELRDAAISDLRKEVEILKQKANTTSMPPEPQSKH